MNIRTHALGVSLTLLLSASACRESQPDTEELEAVPISGMYQVKGATVAVGGGHKREIAGIVILAENGDRYTATFQLNTTYPGAEEALPAEVIGKGDGSIEGRTLRGTAETQLVMATVPGVDPGFAFVPRMVSTRITSTSVAKVAADGSVSIQIENQPVMGSNYSPTRTTLSGQRVSDAGAGDAPKTAGN